MTQTEKQAGRSSRALGEIVTLVSGMSPSGFTFGSSGVPYFKVEQIGSGGKGLSSRSTPYHSPDLPTVPAGSVVIAKRGGSIALNRVGVLEQPSFMDTNVMALCPHPELATDYLYYWITHRGLWDLADVTSVPQINNKHIVPLRIELPHLPEQKRIAEALTDADELIVGLERLITKKQAIKHGMMQQLLTGQTRLPGFTREWLPLEIASQSELRARIGWQGLTASEYRNVGEYRLVGGTEFRDGRVDWKSTPYVDAWRFEQDRGIQLRPGDVLITKDGTIGKVAYIQELPGPATLNSGVFVVRPLREAYDSHFFYFLLRSRVFEDFLLKLKAGSTISHLYQRDLVGLVLDMPPSLREQRAIASALADTDAEIDVLRSRLGKARAIKVGMMQELLTGRTRLPVTEGVA